MFSYASKANNTGHFSAFRREIQNDEMGHCSIEDAKACMELVQLKVEKGEFCRKLTDHYEFVCFFRPVNYPVNLSAIQQFIFPIDEYYFHSSLHLDCQSIQ